MNDIADHGSAEAAPGAALLDPQRCQFSFADGRRCRMARCEEHPALCVAHARAEAKTESRLPAQTSNLAGELAPLSGEFRTATDINHVLGKLFSLLAQNRIPRRNAVALGYLAQLLLQTLPGVRNELTRCLGYQAWDETLDSVFCEHETEAGAEDEAEDDSEASDNESDDAEAAAEGEVAASDDQGAAAARTEPGHIGPNNAEAEHAQAEIAAEPDPVGFAAAMPASWSYWKELEQNEQLHKMRR